MKPTLMDHLNVLLDAATCPACAGVKLDPQCSECHGAGIVGSLKEPCPCGDGFLRTAVKVTSWILVKDEPRPQPVHTTGEMRSKCPDCEGTGQRLNARLIRVLAHHPDLRPRAAQDRDSSTVSQWQQASDDVEYRVGPDGETIVAEVSLGTGAYPWISWVKEKTGPGGVHGEARTRRSARLWCNDQLVHFGWTLPKQER